MNSNYYHLNARIISRGQGNSIVATVAYIYGDKFRDNYTGKLHDRTYRQDVIYKRVMLPFVAPRVLEDPQLLLDALNVAERRRDAQMARSYILSLPNILQAEEWAPLIEAYITESFTKNNMVAIAAIHSGKLDITRKPRSIVPIDRRTDNPHAHIIVPFRALDSGGFQRTKITSRAMNTHDALIELRKSWETLQNRLFERLGIPDRVSSLSLAAQGISRKPTPHMGAAVMALESRGKQTSRGDMYRDVIRKNKERDKCLEWLRTCERIRERDR